MEESKTKQGLRSKLVSLDRREREYLEDMTKIVDELKYMKLKMRRWQLFLKATSFITKAGTVVSSWHHISSLAGRGLDIFNQVFGLSTKVHFAVVKHPLNEHNQEVIDRYCTKAPNWRYWTAANNASTVAMSFMTDHEASVNALLALFWNTSMPRSEKDMDQRIEDAENARLEGKRAFIRKRNEIKRLLRSPEYTVQSGDSLWRIAERQLGDGKKWIGIYAINHSTIGDNPNLIYPGQRLLIPQPVSV